MLWKVVNLTLVTVNTFLLLKVIENQIELERLLRSLIMI